MNETKSGNFSLLSLAPISTLRGIEMRESKIDDTGIMQFYEKIFQLEPNKKYRGLEIVNIDSCPYITSKGIKKICEVEGSSLAILNVASISVSQEVLQCMVTFCTRLDTLNLTSSQVNDTNLQILQGCKFLRILNLTSLPLQKPTESIEKLLHSLKYLGKLNLTEIPCSKEKLLRQFSHIKFIF